MIKKTLQRAWYNQTMAHAYILIGPIETNQKELNDFWQKTIDSFSSYPDKVELHFDSLGVDESRLLKTSQINRSLSGGRRFFVISFYDITIPAQNALLKVLEEPSSQTIFFILTTTIEKLLPTVISRCQVITQLPLETISPQIKLADQFICSGPKQRLDLIEKYFNSKEIDNRIKWHNFLNILETKIKLSAIEKIWQNRRWLQRSGYPLNFITNHLAISLPVMLK